MAIVGIFDNRGYSYESVVVGANGCLRVVVPKAAVAEVRRNLAAKLPESAPLFEEFLRAVPLQLHRPTPHDRERARELADAKDVPIFAAAIGAGARILVPHNIRQFHSSEPRGGR